MFKFELIDWLYKEMFCLYLFLKIIRVHGIIDVEKYYGMRVFVLYHKKIYIRGTRPGNMRSKGIYLNGLKKNSSLN